MTDALFAPQTPGVRPASAHTGSRPPAVPSPAAGGTARLQPRVIGLDLACDSTGIALPDGDTFTVRAPKQAGKTRTLADNLRRMHHVGGAIEDVLAHYDVDLAVIEDYAPGIRSAAAHRLAEIGGIVRVACHRAEVPIALVNVMHLKIYATGTTKAEKRDMSMEAFKRAGVEFPNSDECDAWWLRAMGLDHLGHPVVEVPKAQRAALYPKTKKDVWPEVTR